MQRAWAPGRTATMTGGRTDDFGERFLGTLGTLGTLGKLTAPPGKRLIDVAERGRGVDGGGLTLVRFRRQAEPRPVSFLWPEVCDVLQPLPQREALVGPRLPTPFLTTEPFRPLPGARHGQERPALVAVSAVERARMPPRVSRTAARDALTAGYFSGASTQEAAARRLGLPYGTYRRHLRQGLDLLCEVLWEQELRRPR
ncbi:hypothetical protein ADK64_32670 [Streptomyces sp. MMG1121]|nr:hypothetical protein ADK64_32670 [Streptomyces sp. MMG1121]